MTQHKVRPYRVMALTNQDPEFYRIVGPFLSRREIVAELGAPVWDDDGKRWWVAVADEAVLGLVALKGREVCSFYVEPGSRGAAIGYALVRSALAGESGDVKAVATPASRDMFESFGFRETGRRGRYHVMERAGRP